MAGSSELRPSVQIAARSTLVISALPSIPTLHSTSTTAPFDGQGNRKEKDRERCCRRVGLTPFPQHRSRSKSFIHSRRKLRWRVLPPEIIHIVVEILGTDRQTLSACSLVSHEFTFPALCCLGRHIAVNTACRLQECVSLISEGSAFHHVRSLDLGISTNRITREKSWDDPLFILGVFGHRHTLTRLWLSEVRFHFSKYGSQEMARNAIASLATTVNELGLYSCYFSSYTEMISLVRAFPLCTSLNVRDCATRKVPGADVFVQLPQYTLHISDLELTSLSSGRPVIDVSNLIKDAALDVSSLTGFSCGMRTADAAHRTTMTAVAAPIQRFQLICNEAKGFYGASRLSESARVSLMLNLTEVPADPAVTRWPLKSLTIGPLAEKCDWWCERIALLCYNLPHLGCVNILSCYDGPVVSGLSLWGWVDRSFSREDIFPRLEKVNIFVTAESQRLQQSISRYLPTLCRTGKLYSWDGKREFTSLLYGTPR